MEKIILILLSIFFFTFSLLAQQEFEIGNSTQLTKVENGKIQLQSPNSVSENNNFKISFENNSVNFYDNNQKLVFDSGQLGSLSTIDVYGGGGDDLLTVDFGGLQQPVNIFYDGQNNFAGTIGDRLQVDNGTFEKVESNFYNKHDGLLLTDGSSIEYRGLEPIDFSGSDINNLVLNYTASSSETINLGDNPSIGDNVSSISSTQGELLDFPTPNTSLTITTNVASGSGSDIVNFNGMDALTPNTLIINIIGDADDQLNVDAQGNTFIDNGTSVQITGSYTINYSGFGTVNVINGAPLAVPTLSEWGLIILIVLIMTLGILYMASSQAVFSNGQMVWEINNFKQLPFNRNVYLKILGVLGLVMLVMVCIAVFIFGYEMTNADPFGLLIVTPILAYLLLLLK